MVLSPFNRQDYAEQQKAVYYLFQVLVGCIIAFLVFVPIVTTVYAFIKFGVSTGVMGAVKQYWAMAEDPLKWWDWHITWITNVRASNPMDWRFFFIPVEIVTAFGGAGVLFCAFMLTNPYTFLPTTFGNARMASNKDVSKMGLDKGWICVLGDWHRKFLKLPETLSVLCVAPPGTGKTVAIVVPTILTCDNVSMIINDVKPELFDLTSGYRSRHSYCFKLEWAAADNPEKGIFYPRWNVLSPLSMPPPGAQRDLYVDRVVNIMIEEPKGSADPHWTKRGRAVLAGFIHYLCSKIEAGNYTNIPAEWQGKEPSIPMLLDWMTEAQIMAQEKTEALRKSNPMAAMNADPMRDMLLDAVKECRQGNYSNRAVLELTALANTPDKERGSILSTMDGGLIVFKNKAVRDRTSKSDFSFLDVRGIKDPLTGIYKPVSIYVCVNQEDARALGVITGLLIEALSAWLVAHKPNDTTADGRKVGPCPALFVLDEFPQMPKLQALIDGPAVGRGQKVSFLMIGQDLGQIATKYGKEETETVISTTAAKVILPQNNEQTAKRFSEMVGQRTVETASRSRTVGVSKETNPFAANVQRSLQGQPLLRPEDFMTIPKGKHYVLFQGYLSRPILCDTPAYYKHRILKDLVAPKFGGKIPPASPMPDFMHAARVEEYHRDKRDDKVRAALRETVDA
ncbi:MAG: type IV secretory system conjugative DNA transfer family protein [Alphaproteobacteria bacterium]|jgi:type IV secretion system protein VirD4|nr:type IV secretory system conjugative DNA transfer family protein [Alphaproteobacteria bacterium]